MFKIITMFSLLSAVAAGTEPQIDPKILQGADKYARTVLAGDPSAVAALYQEDGVVMPAGLPLLRGRAAIEQFYRECFKSMPKMTAFTFSHLEGRIVGDTIYDVGTYQQTLSVGGARL
jgi:uncharacterized protein (TIGR02246 family)